MQFDEDTYLEHYGVIRRSGRYPWGSGDNVVEMRNATFLDHVKKLKAEGWTNAEIAKGFGMKTRELVAAISYESNALRQANIARVQQLRDRGNSVKAISERTGIPERTVHSYLEADAADKATVLFNTVNALKGEVAEKGLIDVSKGTEAHVGVSRTRMDNALEVLKQEGYEVHRVPLPQATNRNRTNTLVLCPPGTAWKDVMANQDKISVIGSWTENGGRSPFGTLHEPLPIDPKRVQVIYGPDGGDKADGVLYVRPNVPDVSIGNSRYAQVRVAVGKDHFLKGMAVYKDDLPEGIDIQFNTNKKDTGNPLDAMKKNVDDNGYLPGGPHPLMKSVKRQILKDEGTDKERPASVMNLVNEEGNWAEWSKTLSSQMLSKQRPELAKAQLDMTYERRQMEFDDIMKLTNPTVRRKLLEEFSSSVDSAAVHLKAAALPRTASHVIMPLTSIKRNEIYAPNYDNGEIVVLIRHPHGGKFEIPELVVNNKNREGRKLLGDSKDVVGIHHSVAERLSGADFDGDTVLVIPNKAGKVEHSRALEDLKNFDPKRSYPYYEGMKVMRNTQQEMGSISNLITDMTIKGAPYPEIARAVKHSMVVIDAEKHKLNYKQSELDQGIKQLKAKYQTGGASTLISRAGSEIRVDKRKPRPYKDGGPINRQTGALEYVPTGETHWKTGKPLTEKSKKLAETDDARTLMSSKVGTRMEQLYASHSNKLKDLANKARLAQIDAPRLKYSPDAAKAYKPEVEALNNRLALGKRNLPLERHAQRLAAVVIKARKEANPDMDEETEKKIRNQAINQARIRTGASKFRIDISQKEWDAIQAGAISDHKLNEILNFADMKVVKDLATPKNRKLMTATKVSRAKAMFANGYTREEVAEALGVSVSTLDLSMAS